MKTPKNEKEKKKQREFIEIRNKVNKVTYKSCILHTDIKYQECYVCVCVCVR